MKGYCVYMQNNDLRYKKILIKIDRFKIFEIYANEMLFSEILFYSYKNKDSEEIPNRDNCRNFIYMSLLLLINKPSDLQTCIKGVAKRKQLEFLEFLLHHEMMNPNVYTFLGSDMELVKKLPFGFWIEIPISHYCAYLLSTTNKLLSIHEALPLYEIASDDMKEYVFSRCYENNRLDKISEKLFGELFPYKYNVMLNNKNESEENL